MTNVTAAWLHNLLLTHNSVTDIPVSRIIAR